MQYRPTLLALTLAFQVTSANAVLLTVAPTIDGYALDPPWTSIASLDEILVAQLPDAGAQTPEARSALEFALTGVPSGMVVDSATLYLFGELADFNIGVHGYTGNGTLESSDFSLSNEILQFDPQFSAWNVVNVTSFIQGLHAATSPFAGFQLRELVPGEVTTFISSDHQLPQYRPHLDITYSTAVPEPATLALLGLGLAGLAASRRRKLG